MLDALMLLATMEADALDKLDEFETEDTAVLLGVGVVLVVGEPPPPPPQPLKLKREIVVIRGISSFFILFSWCNDKL